MLKVKSSNTILYCKRWEEAIVFYKTKLKLEVTVAYEWFIEFKLTDYSCISIADESRTSIKSSRGQGITITIGVEDIEATHLFLKEAQCNPSSIKDHAWGAKLIHVYDPDGNRLEFWSPK